MNTNIARSLSSRQPLTRALRLLVVLLVSLVALSGSQVIASRSGNALDFDGTGDYADGSGISTTLSAITLEAWVYHRTLLADQQRYVTVRDEVAVIRHDGASQLGQLHFYIKDGGSFHSIRVNDALQTGRWYHVAGTWDGTDMKLYLNGELVGEATPGGGWNAPDGTVLLSRSDEAMDGYIDDVRIWNDARTQTEIRENMHIELGGLENGLEHYWQLNESAGTTAYDSAGTVDLTLHDMFDDDWVTSTAPIVDDPGVYLVPDTAEGAEFPGNTVTYTETLFNYTGASDSFTLTLSGEDWTSALSLTDTGTLSHGASVEFTLWVTVPLGATPDASDTVTIQAVSDSSPSVYSDTATITTTALVIRPEMQSINPVSNTHTAPLTTSVSITYDQPMSTTTVSTQTFGTPWKPVYWPKPTASMGGRLP